MSISKQIGGEMVHQARFLFAVFLAASCLVLLAGCSDEEDGAQAETDEEALEQMILEDEEIEGVNPWCGDDDLALGGGGGLDEPVDPIYWGRLGERRLVAVHVEIEGDTFATITCHSTFNGIFRLVTDTTGNVRTVLDKEMHNTIVRKAHAVRVAYNLRPRFNWRITEVSAIYMVNSNGPEPHMLEPAAVRMYRVVDGAPVLVAEVTDPLNTYFSRDNLPTVYPGDELIVRIQSAVGGNLVAVLHPHVRLLRPHPRVYLHDDGVTPDEVAGDAVWSGSCSVGNYGGVFLSGADLIDWETIYDTEAPYDAGGWAIPYRVSLSP